MIKKLSIVYYLMLALAIATAAHMYYHITNGNISPLDPSSTLGQAIQYIVIFYVLASVPGGLYWHKRTCDKITTLDDKLEQERLYGRSALLRIIIVSLGITPAIACFYWMGAYQPMLWIAAIAAIGWYFTKPTEAKMEAELTPKDPNQETY